MRNFQLDYDYETRDQLIEDIFTELKITYSYELNDNKVRFFIPQQEINCEIYDLDEGIKVDIID